MPAIIISPETMADLSARMKELDIREYDQVIQHLLKQDKENR